MVGGGRAFLERGIHVVCDNPLTTASAEGEELAAWRTDPKGYFEAFANIYSTFIGAVAKMKRGEALNGDDWDVPFIEG